MESTVNGMTKMFSDAKGPDLLIAGVIVTGLVAVAYRFANSIDRAIERGYDIEAAASLDGHFSLKARHISTTEMAAA